jgi:hypothetical protein
MHAEGIVSEVRLLPDQSVAAWISCPDAIIPDPGQYVLAYAVTEVETPLATPLFLAERGESGFLAAPSATPAWTPGTRLKLRGPLGRGFRFPSGGQRLALICLGETSMRLLPLIPPALGREMAVALFSDHILAAIPTSVEIYPLHDLAEAISWADFIALDLSPDRLRSLRNLFGLKADQPLACQAQALILTDMPCGGLAECGACAVPARRKWKLSCSDGPVFDLADVEW